MSIEWNKAYKKALNKRWDYSQDLYIDAKIADQINSHKLTEEQAWLKGYKEDMFNWFKKSKELSKRFTKTKITPNIPVEPEHYERDYVNDKWN